MPAPSQAKPGLRLPAAVAGWRSLLLTAGVALAGSLAMFLLEAHGYLRFGYRLYPWATAGVFAAAALVLLAPLLRSSGAAPVLLAVLLAYAGVALLSIASFPLDARRSDMLPLLMAAGRDLLAGRDPYRLYRLPGETVFLTYLPGTVLAYLPAALLGFDPRLLSVAETAALAVAIVAAARRRFRRQTAGLLGVWLLSPYLLYRHEIYTAPHWLALTLAMLLASRGRFGWAAAAFGVSMAMSQFSWVLFPFFWVYSLHRRGWRGAAAVLAGSLATAMALVAPFLLWGAQPMIYGVLSHWTHAGVNARPVNLSFLVAKVVGAGHLQLVQAAVLAVLVASAAARRGCSTLAGCLRWMSAALVAFVLLNILVWGYFFLLAELLLLLYVVAANGWLVTSEPAEALP